MAIGLTAMVSAQGGRLGQAKPGAADPRQKVPAAETVTVSGSLVVVNGSPALKSGDVTYVLGGVNRLSGFIDGFKEGSQVTIEGRAFGNPRDENTKFLRATKLTLNGKSYDMAPVNPGFGMLRQFNQHPHTNRQFTPNPRTNRYQRPAPQNRQHRPGMPGQNLPRQNMPRQNNRPNGQGSQRSPRTM